MWVHTVFLDHDSYVLQPLDEIRRCCAPEGPQPWPEPSDEQTTTATGRGAAARSCARPAALIAGFEQEESGRKLNPGTMMAEPHAEFLQLWRASWSNCAPLHTWAGFCGPVTHRALPLANYTD